VIRPAWALQKLGFTLEVMDALDVPQRADPRPRLDGADRAVLTAFIRHLPQVRAAAYRLVTPTTVVALHRRLVAKRWNSQTRSAACYQSVAAPVRTIRSSSVMVRVCEYHGPRLPTAS
jgi:hypothetical protein